VLSTIGVVGAIVLGVVLVLGYAYLKLRERRAAQSEE
jgi:heme/copper-type cytochrome/quinol oxidase subunit 2